ncbi:hypothetical protein FB451DRAFT_1397867 [Mycena latifolia]|nr:hypothetical protein FB451DRAFT_1397867 [Mycena latifolia]
METTTTSNIPFPFPSSSPPSLRSLPALTPCARPYERPVYLPSSLSLPASYRKTFLLGDGDVLATHFQAPRCCRIPYFWRILTHTIARLRAPRSHRQDYDGIPCHTAREQGTIHLGIYSIFAGTRETCAVSRPCVASQSYSPLRAHARGCCAM